MRCACVKCGEGQCQSIVLEYPSSIPIAGVDEVKCRWNADTRGILLQSLNGRQAVE